jgi:hypothetical protein
MSDFNSISSPLENTALKGLETTKFHPFHKSNTLLSALKLDLPRRYAARVGGYGMGIGRSNWLAMAVPVESKSVRNIVKVKAFLVIWLKILLCKSREPKECLT